MIPLFLDFETRSAVDIKKAGADAYAEDPSTDILCVGWALGEGPCKVSSPTSFFSSILPSLKGKYDFVVAHNAHFEMAIWNKCAFFKYNVEPLFPHSVRCTMVMAYAMGLPGALADAAPALGLDIKKDMPGHRVMLQLSQPRSVSIDNETKSNIIKWWTYEDAPEKWKQLIQYCRQDIEVERELYRRLLRLSGKEQALWELDWQINQRGVAVDIEAIKKAIRIVEAEKEYANQEVKWLTGNAVATITAVAQMTEWLNDKGVRCEGVAKAGVLEMLAKPDLPKEVRQVLILRQESAKSSTAKLKAMLEGVCRDGRIKGMFQYHGTAQTGRWAGRRIQLHNMIRKGFSVSETEELFNILNEMDVA